MRSKILLPLVLLLCLATSAATLRQVAIVDIPGRPGFDELAFANGMLVMTHAGAGTVDIFDPVKRRVIAHITNMAEPRSIAVDEDAGRVYIGNAGTKSVVVVAFDGWKVENQIQLSVTPEALMLSPGGKRLFVLDQRGQALTSVDPSQGRELSSAKLGANPSYMTFDNGRTLIYVTLQDAKEVIALDPALQVVKRFKVVASQPTGIVYDQKQDRIYVAVRYAVLSLNAQTGTENARVAAPAGVDKLWLDDESRTLYAAAGGSVMVMSTGSRLTATDEIPTDVKGHTLAFDPAKKMIYFPGGREGRSKLLILRNVDNNAIPDQTQNAELR